MSIQTLNQKLNGAEELGFLKKEIPDFITRNLNPAFVLRPYQISAFSRFSFYLNDFPARLNPTHLLFHMATGSGKTLIMAGAILYLYEQGYRNFIFFVNSTNIIEKTRDNFLNPLSSKYLFAPQIVFGPQQVHIKEVSNFQTVNPNDINILFTTIQGLHTRLNNPRENALTYEDFENQRIVLISDEAHHINALTKSKLTKTEAEEATTWEYTVNKIFTTSPENILLEFTATVELNNSAISEKYADKIIFEYTLKEFRQDGYSKDVKVLQADMEPLDRALQAVILSQYRRKVAEKHGLHVKPVILMKSRTIADSESIEAEFYTAIQQLTPARLQSIKNNAVNTPTNDDHIMQRAFSYFESEGISLDNLVIELKEDFAPEHCLSVNSKSDSEEKQLLVNSLEDRTNPIRVIFAVDKLNEGWDVLNLFDIVRLYNTRDAKQGKPGRTTIAEAQLIGRGARYYPFRFNDTQPLYQRKFDDDITNELRVLEELHYHSAHNPRYIQELRQVLVESGILPNTTKEIHLKVKDSFKKTPFWKNGHIFINNRIRNSRTNITGLTSIPFTKRHTYRLRTGFTQDTTIFDAPNTGTGGNTTATKAVSLPDLGTHVVRKALNKLPFYYFNNLKKYFPHLQSITQFITSLEYLGQVQVDINGTKEQINHLSQDEKLAVAIHVLEHLSQEIQSATADYIGTTEFTPHAIKETVKDKVFNIVIDKTSEKEFGVAMSAPRNPALSLDLSKEDWYVYDENYGTSEEKYLVKFIYSAIETLNKRYKTIYLLRNAKLFQIYRFSDGHAIEPDFVLFLIEEDTGKQITYQLFIEPKGSQLLKTDSWKEDFLLEIEGKYKFPSLIVYENKEFFLVGMPFYNEEERKKQFEVAFERFLPKTTP